MSMSTSELPPRFSTPPPEDVEGQVRWLVDRARISDLLLDFARRVDEKDQAGYAANFAVDGVLELPFGEFSGRETILGMRGPQLPMVTHHISANHMIEIDGDTARTRSYLQATHVADLEVPTKNWKAGGWYDCQLQRCATGWEFTRVKLSVIWAGGDDASSMPV
jgi:hypothetical protein